MLFDDLDLRYQSNDICYRIFREKERGRGKKYLKIKIMEKPNNTQIKKKLHVKKRVKI